MKKSIQSLSAVSLLPSLFTAMAFTNPAAASPLALEEITVTAQKRAESIQDIPIAASAFSSEKIRESGLSDPQDLSKIAPSVNIWSSFGESSPKVTIRGIGSSNFNQNTESTAVIYMDEFPLTPVSAKLPQFFDLERVEVLRGPQGTLYGKNSTGGAVNVITRRPSGETGGNIAYTAGKYGQSDLEAAYETSLTDEWSIRVAGKSQHRDGYGENTFDGSDIYDKESLAGRVSVLYEGDNLTAYGKIWGHKSGADGYYVRTYSGATNAPLSGSASDPYEGSFNPQKSDIDNVGANFNLDYELGDYTLSLVTGYLKSDNYTDHDCDGTAISICAVIFDLEAEETSTEVRLTSNFDGAFNWIAGFNYFTEKLDIINQYGGAFSATQGGKQKSKSMALFADATWDMNESLQLLFGVRWNQDKKDFKFGGTTIVPPFAFDIDDSETWREITYRAGFDWSIDDDKNLYFTYSKGYRAGAYDTGFITNPVDQGIPTDPEFVTNYELGLKSFWWDQRVQLNLAAFHMELEDQQLLVVGPSGFCCSQANAGESEIQGIELEGAVLFSEQFRLGFSANYLDTEYKEFVRDGRDLSGERLANAPSSVFTLNPEFTFPMNDGELFVAADISRSSDVRVGQDFDLQKRDVQKAYTQVDARLGYRADNFQVILWGKNLGDKEVIRDWLDFSATFGYYQEIYGEPRSYGVTVNYDF